MKKSFILLLVTGMLFLAGCGSTASTGQPGTSTTAVEGQLDETTQLMAGTMLLETTDYPLDAGQIDSLLFLWKGYSVVSTSQTSADAEINGLLKQIKGELTAEQIAAIESMQLTTQSMTEKLRDAGIEMAGTGPMGAMDPEAQATIQALQDSGEMPQMPEGGQMPSGGGNMPSGGGGGQMPPGGIVVSGNGGDVAGMDLGQAAAMQAGSSVTGLGQRGTNTMLLNALIDYLKGLANS